MGWDERLAQACAAGDPEGVVGLLVEMTDRSAAGSARTASTVGGLTPVQRATVLRLLLARRDAGPDAGPARSIDDLITDLAPAWLPGLPSGSLRSLMDDAARNAVVGIAWITALLRHAVEQGAPVPGEAVAVARRSLINHRWSDHTELKDVMAAVAPPPLNPGEAWADAALAAPLDPGWTALLGHAATAGSASPSARWEKRARTLLDDAGPDAARERILALLPLVPQPRTLVLRPWYGPDPNLTLDPHNADALRGLLWMLAIVAPHPDTARALGRLAQYALRKVPGLGPRSPKIANACVTTLARIDGEESLAQLARLATTVTFKATLKVIDAALDTRAEALGLGREEIEELAVPGYGLTEVGRRVERLGDAEAELVVEGSQAVLRWRNAAGKVVKSPPASVRRDHPEELKELKAAVKDISAMLTAQSERIDRQFLALRSWRFADWRARYLDHPLVGTLARRLLWLVDGTPVAFTDGELRGLDDAAVTPGEEARVELWHPVGRPVAEVLAWRGRLEAHGVTQPFKQAHREVYLLTAAEEGTGVYSNRFAAHVLRQHQFHALAAARGWSNRLRMMVDDSYPPASRDLPEWGLRAEYWIEGAGENYGEDTTESGSFLRLTTDQVRFHRIGAAIHHAHAWGGGYRQSGRPEPARGLLGRLRRAPAADPAEDPVPLSEIPPLVFSEVMRDVDLFVGVASVGNDPTWQDGGPGGRFQEYWHSYGFGELGATAQTRRDALERLLPRLAVGKVASLDGRFLRVRGELRSYRIHLGSGNILMDPDDRYLCIVPQSAARIDDGVFLPFEGDRTFATILSKAMLLANDSAITDPSITSQIGRRT